MTTSAKENEAPNGPSASKAMLERLEKLRDTWGEQAWGIERTHGDEDPAAKAIRACIGDLYACIHADEF